MVENPQHIELGHAQIKGAVSKMVEIESIQKSSGAPISKMALVANTRNQEGSLLATWSKHFRSNERSRSKIAANTQHQGGCYTSSTNDNDNHLR